MIHLMGILAVAFAWVKIILRPDISISTYKTIMTEIF